MLENVLKRNVFKTAKKKFNLCNQQFFSQHLFCSFVLHFFHVYTLKHIYSTDKKEPYLYVALSNLFLLITNIYYLL